MGEGLDRDLAVSAAVGCATGFFWSVVAGRSDPFTSQGFTQAAYGCLGSSASAASVYSVSRRVSGDRDLARTLTATSLGLQSAASLTNWLGFKYRLQEKPAFNAVAFPLNFSATPLTSIAGLLAGAAGDLDDGEFGRVSFFGGGMLFHHKTCPLLTQGFQGFQLGAITHYCSPLFRLEDKFHENAHLVQSSVLGDVGVSLAYFLNGGFLSPWSNKVYRQLIAEKWADSYAEQAMYHFSLSEDFLAKRQGVFERRAFLQERRLDEKLRLAPPEDKVASELAYLDAEQGALRVSAQPKSDVSTLAWSLGTAAGLSGRRLRDAADLADAAGWYSKMHPAPQRGRLFANQQYFEIYSQALADLAEEARGNISAEKYDLYVLQLQKFGSEGGVSPKKIREDLFKIAGYAYAFYSRRDAPLLNEFAPQDGKSVSVTFQKISKLMRKYGRDASVPPEQIIRDRQDLWARIYSSALERGEQLASRGEAYDFWLDVMRESARRMGLHGAAANFTEDRIESDISGLKELSLRVQGTNLRLYSRLWADWTRDNPAP